MRPDGPRDPVAGPDSGPEAPYPIRLSGPVIKGFGRGSKELGIPTANIPPDGLSAYPSLPTGVYYGVITLDPARFIYNTDESTGQAIPSDAAAASSVPATILPAVLSIGYNPFYKNEVKSIEIHIMPPLSSPSPTSLPVNSSDPLSPSTQFYKLPDFYSTTLKLLILGYIRPEYDYVSLEALVEDIRIDCEVARQSLRRPAYARYLADEKEEKKEDGEDRVEEERAWLRIF
ncbi:riboflavin kinase-domain-containing protein [Talaromyces proteolyticus]|uniref:Riboflavin kinase n=1 Tax=Talaromyces proteolyticus TaxID=1131652 RepID=A0AAD4L2H0_9EURO|nr:riboflavin kinase-domain-containing protein [Talaromyces proteolyticus]KAH8704753.1 riboflavin kinase-domain-containing protein [Talaromyces proteolyticus]